MKLHPSAAGFQRQMTKDLQEPPFGEKRERAELRLALAHADELMRRAEAVLLRIRARR